MRNAREKHTSGRSCCVGRDPDEVLICHAGTVCDIVGKVTDTGSRYCRIDQ